MLDRIRTHCSDWLECSWEGGVNSVDACTSIATGKSPMLGVLTLGLVCAGLGVPSAFSHHAYYNDYPYPGYPPATAAVPAPVPQYGSTAARGRGPEQCRNDVCGARQSHRPHD